MGAFALVVKRSLKKCFSHRLVVLLAVLLYPMAYAQVEVLDKAEVETFVSDTMGKLLADSWVPGAVVTIVQGNEIVSLQGIGIANIDTGEPVDPQRSLVRIGSISKTVTALATLKMVDKGMLELDGKVNNYLRSVQLPGDAGKAVTVRDLLTHRGGFETANIVHLVVNDNAKVAMTPEEVQAELTPVRSRSAARMYDNLGFGVLGYLLQEIQGKPLIEVIDAEVFKPLGMHQSVVGLPDERRQQAASCHAPGQGRSAVTCPQALLRNLVQAAGDFTTTAADMANYLRALINIESTLKPSTAEQMMNFSNDRIHPAMPGMGLTIVEQEFGGRRCRGHGGSIEGFVNQLCIFPGQQIGVFVSVLGNGSGEGPELTASGMLRLAFAEQPQQEEGLLDNGDVLNTFVNEFSRTFITPSKKDISFPQTTELADTGPLAGTYFRHDMSRNLWGKLMAPLSAQVVTSTGTGNLMLDDRGPYVQKTPFYFEYSTVEDGVERLSKLAFKIQDGEVLMAQSGYGMSLQQPWYRTTQWTLIPLIASVLVLIVTAIYGFTGRPAAHKRVLKIAGVSFILFLVGLVLELEYGRFAHLNDLRQVFAFSWRLLFAAAVLGFLFVAYKLPQIRRQQVNSHNSNGLFTSVCGLLVCLSCLVMVWLSFYWGLAYSSFV